ncbi:hypothetical protein ANN_15059 [Periplaneta americana]|uniref:Uncharacterized protein n=1 Tax=Periplaneta americana TaxID=6978 RepID=A0ABQ8SZK8_PERAM|nr:hypothetical protein ANN_15059 [Periplaneta americana]
MAGLCEGGSEPSGSLKAICKKNTMSCTYEYIMLQTRAPFSHCPIRVTVLHGFYAKCLPRKHVAYVQEACYQNSSHILFQYENQCTNGVSDLYGFSVKQQTLLQEKQNRRKCTYPSLRAQLLRDNAILTPTRKVFHKCEQTSSTRVCVRNCVSIRRPEFECSGPQLEGPEFECSGPQLEGPEFEYSEPSEDYDRVWIYAHKVEFIIFIENESACVILIYFIITFYKNEFQLSDPISNADARRRCRLALFMSLEIFHAIGHGTAEPTVHAMYKVGSSDLLECGTCSSLRDDEKTFLCSQHNKTSTQLQTCMMEM